MNDDTGMKVEDCVEQVAPISFNPKPTATGERIRAESRLSKLSHNPTVSAIFWSPKPGRSGGILRPINGLGPL